MPIFEYKCTKCGAEFDELESVKRRDEPHECPKCGSMESERKMSMFSMGSCSDGGGGGKICPTSGST